jgi:hypothetical protein
MLTDQIGNGDSIPDASGARCPIAQQLIQCCARYYPAIACISVEFPKPGVARPKIDALEWYAADRGQVFCCNAAVFENLKRRREQRIAASLILTGLLALVEVFARSCAILYCARVIAQRRANDRL